MARHWVFKPCACIIFILISGALRDTLAINCSDIEFRDIITLSEKVQAESPRFSKATQEARIIGGTYQGGRLPYMVAICRTYKYDDEHKRDRCSHSDGLGNVCAGVIIDGFYILTAASCIEDFKISGMTVVAGAPAFPQYPSLDGEIRNVSFKVVHDEFRRAEDRIDNDLAILKVDREIQLEKYSGQKNEKYRKISLADISQGTPKEKTGNIYGWGCTYFSKNECQYFNAEELQKATVPIWTDGECREMLSKLKKPIVIEDFHICAAGTEETGFCYGDAGSPLVITLKGSEEEFLLGIASFLAAPSCGCDDIPTVYTEVSHYREWIQNVLSGKYDPEISQASIQNSNEWIVLHFIIIWRNVDFLTIGN